VVTVSAAARAAGLIVVAEDLAGEYSPRFFVIKAVGAASEQGAPLDELLRVGNKVNSAIKTMGTWRAARSR